VAKVSEAVPELSLTPRVEDSKLTLSARDSVLSAPPDLVFVAMPVAEIRVDPVKTPGSSSPSAVARLVESLPTTWGLLSPIGVDSDGVLIGVPLRLPRPEVNGDAAWVLN
jgi:hypothetical protein